MNESGAQKRNRIPCSTFSETLQDLRVQGCAEVARGWKASRSQCACSTDAK